MSDFMFMLESRLSSEQNAAFNAVTAAAEAESSLFLTGGAVRDLLGHFPIRDLDFTVEGSPNKLAKDLVKMAGAVLVAEDSHRKSVELVFPGNVTVEISMSRSERFGKPGARPVVAAGPIYDDLKRRDFTINSLALSLNRASRGLLIDPNNGLGDLDLKQLRTVSNYAFYDDPSRILRLFRFQARFGMTLDERTANHLVNSLEAGMPALIPGETKRRELLAISRESNVAEIFRLLEERGLASLFAPSLTGAKFNGLGLGKLEKAKALIPFGVELHTDHLAIFLSTLTEKFSPKDKAALIKTSELTKQEADNWQKLEGKAKKLEKELMAPKLQRASKLYYALIAVPGDQILYLLLHSAQRIVQDRIKNFLQKHVLVAQEVSDADVEAAGFVRGTP